MFRRFQGKGAKLKVAILYDNTSFKEGLIADWGFSCLVDINNRRILFDTGARGEILLSNMATLGIDPETIDEIFISHHHQDHTGGLKTILSLNPVRVYLPMSCTEPSNAGEVVKIKASTELHHGIYSTGELFGIEQSLVVETEKGLAVIVGCSHPGVRNILSAASIHGRIFALIGGLHGFSEFDLLKSLQLVCPTHCTLNISAIRSYHPDKYVKGGVGKVITI